MGSYLTNCGELHLVPSGYNRGVRISSVILLLLSLLACNRGTPNNDAIRQGVLDRLAKGGFAAMDVTITSVQFNGSQADATVSIAPKGNAGAAMTMKYHLEQQGNKWVVVGRQEPPGSPHGGAAAGAMPSGQPGAASPHGGGMAPAGPPPGGGAMPSPQDLPPTGKKK